MSKVFARFREHVGRQRGGDPIRQVELAQMLGVSARAISAYETGYRIPTREIAWSFVSLAAQHGFACSLEDVLPRPESLAQAQG